jgi:hypothetical protein
MPRSQPPGAQTQWATGAYTTRLHSTTKSTKAFVRTRSTRAPEMRAGVITANMPWKSMNAECGMVAASEGSGASPTPLSRTHLNPPRRPSSPPPGENERLYPITAQSTPTKAMQTMERFIVWTAFFDRTRPP